MGVRPIDLPWPEPRLSPNARLHWAERARLVRDARLLAWTLARSVAPPERWSRERPLPVQILFHPPDRRRRDRDNMIASFKSYADGIADAIGVDDADWLPTYRVCGVVKGGKVTVEIG